MDVLDGAKIKELAASGGDQARMGFQLFWEAYYRKLTVFARAYRGLPRGERDDAVADALISAYGSIASYDPRRPLSPWVYRVAASRFSETTRRAARFSVLGVGVASDEMAAKAESVEPAAPGDHAEEMVERDLVERCRLAIEALPDLDRRIAMLRFYEGMNAADIARALAIPAGTVRWRVHAIRAGIRVLVGEDVS